MQSKEKTKKLTKSKLPAKPAKKLRTLAEAVSSRLTELYPDAACALQYEGDPWRLFVMARLSAQCTDKRVNEISPALFAEIPTPQAAAQIELSRLEELIRSCGLYREKAKSIRESARILSDRYGGCIPREEEELLALPGVGRKIANLLRGDLYGCGGVVCDTHCIRVCGRLGFYPEDIRDPLKVERILNPLIPEPDRSAFCHRIVLVGREHCPARGADCSVCPLSDLCTHAATHT
ncbi:MAG: endonuclease III domain-containing protein [Eubacteriales bacterium]